MVAAVSNTVKGPCLGVLIKFQFHSLCPLSGFLLGPSTLLVSSFPACRVPRDGRLCGERKEGHFLWVDGGPKVRRREPVKVGKWEQVMKFREASAGGRKGVLWGGQLRLKKGS